MLEAEGLVVNEPHHESRVSNFSASDAAELYELRVHLEGYATRLAVPKIGAPEIAELKRVADLHNKAVDARDDQATARYNQAWHMAIYRSAAQSSFLYEFISKLWNAFPWTTAWMDPRRGARSVKEHKRIMAAIIDHDAALAEVAMREHVIAGKEFVIRRLSKEASAPVDGAG
jgi:DNA-binding GntR family transcriptional regulator